MKNPSSCSGVSPHSDRWPRLPRLLETNLAPTKKVNGILSRIARRLVDRLGGFPHGVYILAYHSVVDPVTALPWEKAYDKGWIRKYLFESQMKFFSRVMTPVRLSEVPMLMEEGRVNQARFAVTFDDGYTDILDNAAPVLDRLEIYPTLFVNGRFADGPAYYRVIAALLVTEGHSTRLAEELRRRMPDHPWSEDPQVLFDQTKNLYMPGVMEDAVYDVYKKHVGDPSALGVHLTVDQVRSLWDRGWEIGNHTFRHQPLSQLNGDEIDRAITENQKFWANHGINLIPWLAYPNGTVKDVGPAAENWLNAHPDIQGIFCNGGVNFQPTRTEWLRFFPGNGDTASAERILRNQIAHTKAALRASGRESSVHV